MIPSSNQEEGIHVITFIWVVWWYFLCYECIKVGHFAFAKKYQVSTSQLAKNTVQDKTQQHKTRNNQHEMPPPCPPVALPSPSMGRSAAPPTHVAEAGKVPTQGAGAGCALDTVGFPVWGAKQRPIKK
jgi:hypothetical protein